MKLKNVRFANGKVASSFGLLEFDSEGFVKNELSEEEMKKLATLRGFELVKDGKTKAQSKEEKAEETKETDKEEKPKRRRSKAE